jgi:hypothetical protein
VAQLGRRRRMPRRRGRRFGGRAGRLVDVDHPTGTTP